MQYNILFYICQVALAKKIKIIYNEFMNEFFSGERNEEDIYIPEMKADDVVGFAIGFTEANMTIKKRM